jgi:predicted cupin superfamily sugar epimerase
MLGLRASPDNATRQRLEAGRGAVAPGFDFGGFEMAPPDWAPK